MPDEPLEKNEEKEKEKEKEIEYITERTPLLKLMSNPKAILGGFLVYAGIGIPFILKSGSGISELLKNQGPMVAGVIIAILGFVMMAAEMNKLKISRREERFIDVDDQRNNNTELQLKILKDLSSLKNKTNNFTPEQIEELLQKASEKKTKEDSALCDSFESYFSDIRDVLVEQARTADKKASILLDKGTSYSRLGIVFFITSIIIWQVLSWMTEIKEQYIYGMVSCSLLFIFIEFLSAWFLKQYRHFVDTSTYLIKVKSIFDKYMLSFLAIKTLGKESENKESKYQAMLKILEEDIKWPDSYLLKKGDVSFAKEAIETMTHFAKALRSEVKNKGKSN